MKEQKLTEPSKIYKEGDKLKETQQKEQSIDHKSEDEEEVERQKKEKNEKKKAN